MKKIASLLLTIFLSLIACSCHVESNIEDHECETDNRHVTDTVYKESPVEDFEYEMEDGKVVITGYKGSDLEIYIPNKINNRPVTVIGEEAFRGYDMTHIAIPDGVVTIEDHAFYKCKCLETIELPSSLKNIYDSAFEFSALKKVTLPTNLEYLRRDSFAHCENLDKLKIPNNTRVDIQFVEYYSNTFLYTPIGLSKNYEKLDTILVVEKDSYAYQQICQYSAYGLTIEIE